MKTTQRGREAMCNREPRRLVRAAGVGALAALFLIATVAQAVAQEPPAGGLVPSAANFGWTQGQFSVSGDGAAQYRLPLWVPQGRGTATPELALSYNSRSGNGAVGVGWSLGGLSSIAWCPRTHAQDGFSEAGHFDGTTALCLDGTRLLPENMEQLPEREYKAEREIFARIVAYGMEDLVPDYFRVWTKDGRILTFGQTDDSRLQGYRLQAGPDLVEPSLERAPGECVTMAWALNRLEDRNGNATTVEYTRSEGDESSLWWVDMRPSVIRYAPNRRVELVYDEEPRPDPIDGFGGSVHSRLAHRLKSIAMYGGPEGGTAELLREYQLRYRNDSITGRSLLSSVTECDHDGTCKLPLALEWSLGSYDFEEIDGGSFVTDRLGRGLMIGDIDGDGRHDLMFRRRNFGVDGYKLKIRLSTGSGFALESDSGIAGLFGLAQPLDVDADGRTDMLAAVDVPDQDEYFERRLYQSNGITYDYDASRNVIARQDSNGRFEHYQHDALNRLTGWHTIVSSVEQVAINAKYTYDEVGNLETEVFQREEEPSETTTYTYGQNGAPPHALTSRNSATYGYDGAGQQISGPQRTVAVQQRRPAQGAHLGAGQRTEFRYDADGARVLKRDAGQTVVYVPGLFERRNAAGTGGNEIHNLHNIVVDGAVVAQVNRVQAASGGPVTATKVSYLHTDLQGSTVKVTNAAGRPIGSEDDLPRGAVLRPVRPPHRRRLRASGPPAPRWPQAGLYRPRARRRIRPDQHEGPHLRPRSAPLPHPRSVHPGPAVQPEPQPLRLRLEQPHDAHRSERLRLLQQPVPLAERPVLPGYTSGPLQQHEPGGPVQRCWRYVESLFHHPLDLGWRRRRPRQRLPGSGRKWRSDPYHGQGHLQRARSLLWGRRRRALGVAPGRAGAGLPDLGDLAQVQGSFG